MRKSILISLIIIVIASLTGVAYLVVKFNFPGNKNNEEIKQEELQEIPQDNKNVVALFKDNNVVVKSISVESGSEIELPVLRDLDGLAFKGWQIFGTDDIVSGKYQLNQNVGFVAMYKQDAYWE